MSSSRVYVSVAGVFRWSFEAGFAEENALTPVSLCKPSKRRPRGCQLSQSERGEKVQVTDLLGTGDKINGRIG